MVEEPNSISIAALSIAVAGCNIDLHALDTELFPYLPHATVLLYIKFERV